jgi:hypothetical protein
MFNLFDLFPGDDIKYRVSSSTESPAHYGRIVSLAAGDGSVYSVKRFVPYTAPHPPPTYKCLPLEELCLTSEIVSVNKSSVLDVIFVLSPEDVEKDPVSLEGISNLFFIRFEVTDGAAPQTMNWISFRSCSLTSLLFFYICYIRDTMNALLNNTKLSQDNCATKTIKIPSFAFCYLKLSLLSRSINNTEPVSFVHGEGTRIEREFSSTHSKSTRQVHIEKDTLTIQNEAAISIMLQIFGNVLRLGTRSKHPPLNSQTKDIVQDTALNIVELVRFTYNHRHEMLSIKIEYYRDSAGNYFNQS